MKQELKDTLPSKEGRTFSMFYHHEGVYHVYYFDKYIQCQGDYVTSSEMRALCAGVAWVENGKKSDG